MRTSRRRASTLAWQALICVAVLSIWQWGYDLHVRLPWLVPDLLDPYFVSKPSEIFEHFLILSCLKSKMGVFNGWFNGDFAKCMVRNENNLWVATAITLKNTFFGFVTGVSSGFVVGLILGRSDRLSAIFQPFITAVNSIPRIALAPIIVLAFGIGDTSKIVTSWIVVVFLVFFNTFEGARSIDEGFVKRRAAARRERMADHPHRRDPLDDGVGVCVAFTRDLLCADRRHRRRIHRRGTGNRTLDHRVGSAGGSIRDDGRGDRADAGGGGAFGADLAIAGISAALAAA
jgi:ABC-type nitrate/sulfonate/bicarbonate transport system permease component